MDYKLTEIPQRFKSCRDDAKMSQLQVSNECETLFNAENFKVNQKDISKYESGKAKFIPDWYILFWYFKGYDINWIYSGKGTMRRSSPDYVVKKGSETLMVAEVKASYKVEENQLLKAKIEQLEWAYKTLAEEISKAPSNVGKSSKSN